MTGEMEAEGKEREAHSSKRRPKKGKGFKPINIICPPREQQKISFMAKGGWTLCFV